MGDNSAEIRNILLTSLNRIANLEKKYENIKEVNLDNKILLEMIYDFKKQENADYLDLDFLKNCFDESQDDINKSYLNEDILENGNEINIPSDFFKT